MNDEPGFIAAALRDLLASTAVILAAWGALRVATNALTTNMRLRDAIRHILLGGLIAAGMGSLSMAVVARSCLRRFRMRVLSFRWAYRRRYLM